MSQQEFMDTMRSQMFSLYQEVSKRRLDIAELSVNMSENVRLERVLEHLSDAEHDMRLYLVETFNAF